MKASVKSLAGMPNSVESTFHKNGAAALNHSIPACSPVSLVALENALSSKSDLGKDLPEDPIVLSYKFSPAQSYRGEAPNRFYRNETKWNRGVPLFLEYQKLLLPFF